jgi:tetratricopeptide (TPR) repeat protein
MRSWSNSLQFWKLEQKTKPDAPEMAYFAGLMHQERGEFANALKLYAKCLKNNPTHERAYFAMGSISFYKKNYHEALKLYKKALNQKSPYKADILANIAQTHVKLHQVDAAIQCYKKSLTIRNIPENRIWLARLLLFQGKKKSAGAEAAKAAKDGAELSADLKQAFPAIRKSRNPPISQYKNDAHK